MQLQLAVPSAKEPVSVTGAGQLHGCTRLVVLRSRSTASLPKCTDMQWQHKEHDLRT